jgi:phosphoserine phosphatase RsbU/P
MPPDEDARLAELHRLEILYTEPEPVFDRVTAELAKVFDAPMTEMTFMDRDKQYIKSHMIGEQVPKEIAAIKIFPRGASPCAYVIAQKTGLVVGDMAADPRFAQSDAVKMGARFYAGMPLMSGDGHAVGTLCILDNKPRELTQREQQLLQIVADGLMSEVRLRQVTKSLVARQMVMAQDLNHARAVQRFMLPPAEVNGSAFVFTHAYRPMDQIGGDFLDVKEYEDGSVTLLVADVSGHGASAALTSAMTKTAFVRCAATRCTPTHLLTNLNKSLAPTTEPGRFMTALAVTFDAARQIATLATAGHPAPLLIQDSKIASAEVIPEIPLLIDESTKYTECTQVKMSPGDRLLLFTDGAVEARNPQGIMLEHDGLIRITSEAAHLRGPAFLEKVFHSINEFAGHHLLDDVAMVCLEVR